MDGVAGNNLKNYNLIKIQNYVKKVKKQNGGKYFGTLATFLSSNPARIVARMKLYGRTLFSSSHFLPVGQENC